MYFSTKRNSGFTLLELIIIIFVISIGIVTIIVGINRSFDFVQQTRQKVIAINLAKEGMEAIYNIRDTNWKLRAGQKDKCWLNIDPYSNIDGNCSHKNWMESGNYVLDTKKYQDQEYYYLTGGNLPKLDISNGISTGDLNYSICSISGFFQPCPGEVAFSKQGRFFRVIQAKGLFRKDTNLSGGTYIQCQDGQSTDQYGENCGDSGAKEFRFCTTVYYLNPIKGQIELCGLISNFE